MSASEGCRTHTARVGSPDPASHATNPTDDPAGEWVGQGDDDDMDFQPTTESSDDNEFFDPEDRDPESEIHDAEEDSPSGVEIEFRLVEHAATGGEEENEISDISVEAGETQARGAGLPRPARIQVFSPRIIQLLGSTGLRQLITTGQYPAGVDNDNADDDDDNMDYAFGGLRSRRRRKGSGGKSQFPKIPSEVGTKLMDTGFFGTNGYYQDRQRKRKPKLSRKLLSREMGNDRGQITRSTSAITQDLIPSSIADTIIHYDSRCYSGQFSDDGNFFFSCAQDMKVRMYDTSNPYAWKYYKTVQYHYGQWTITDATLSPDNRYLAFSSIRSQVCLAPTDPNENGEPWMLDFSVMDQRRRRGDYHAHASHFGIWSIRFSGDGREIVGGTSDHSVYVYDIEKRQSILRIPGHHDEVNAVCFGDTSSPHILYSGSDDTLIKIWDRRSMGDSREAGVFMGHTEGVTYVDSKGDGRYVLSNGKDQTMKLWDLRKMMSTDKAATLNPHKYTTNFDYRFMTFSEEDWRPHPHDCSLVTYRGHSVLKTLIRCHFSPPGSSNSRYVYSGSEDGSVYIYNLDATLAGKINVKGATHHSRPRNPYTDVENYSIGEGHNSDGTWQTCVRDASWHPNAPIIAATSWNGWGMATGTCTMHSWNDGAEDDEGEPEMGLRVDQKLQQDPRLLDGGMRPAGQSRFRTGLRTQRVPSAMAEDDEENGGGAGVGGSWW